MGNGMVDELVAAHTPQERIVHALAAMPEFHGVQASIGAVVPSIAMPMHLGLDSVSAPVSFSDGRPGVFAKAFRAGALAPYSVPDAAAAARVAGEAQIAPRLMAADASSDVLVFDLLGSDWRMALASDMRKPDVKSAVLAAKKAWHQQAKLSKTVSPFEVLRDYAARLEPHLDPKGRRPIPFKGAIPFNAAMQWISRIEGALSASGTDLGPIHGENAVSNIMIGPEASIRLVDFDRAVNADPIFDLGSLCLEFCRTDKQRMEAVEIYAGRPNQAMLARVKLYGIVDDFLWACWALLAETSHDMVGPEWLKYASNRLIRMNYHLQTFDMRHLLATA
ncbi:phosphotransferase family protein [Oryzicola mucosus]|uniref:Phosphotransferase n=1 Tax=Oryzicola mucosus TaxID=2767425 RepID=A0A8J6PNS2_9HYPH|nr:phosphotransferase [Oryzicola mucosus]MBD0416961.1 phosphotransferase [Oryzicola mucosus]